jgi:hypothetical protein
MGDASDEFDPEAYVPHSIVAARGKGKRRQYLVRWKGYDARGDTWQGAEDVGAGLLAEYHKRLNGPEADIECAVHQLRLALGRLLTSRNKEDRRSCADRELSFPQFASPYVGPKLLERLRQLSGTRAKIERRALGGDRRELLLFLGPSELDAIGRLVSLHATRPEVGVGNLRIHSGGSTHECMMLITPPVTISYTEPAPDKFGAVMGPRSFSVVLSTLHINGKTGDATFPAADEQWNKTDMNVIVSHAKMYLEQPWVPRAQRIRHHLLVEGWHKLPAEKWRLSREAAFRAERPPKRGRPPALPLPRPQPKPQPKPQSGGGASRASGAKRARR